MLSKRYLLIFIVLIIGFSPSAYAQLGISDAAMDAYIQNMPGLTPKQGDDDDIITTFETMFIKEMFIGDMFSSNQLDEEDSSGYGGYFDEIMAIQLSRQLAEQDILNLKQYINTPAKKEIQK